MTNPLFYGIIGRLKSRQCSKHIKDVWAVFGRMSAEDAEDTIKQLVADAERFSAWKLGMMKNHPEAHWGSLVAEYIENRMLDTNYVEGAEYDLLVFPEGA